MAQATAISRRQHNELRRYASELLSLLESAPALDENAIQRTLSRLAGVLKVHVAMEIEGLYPQLLDHNEGEVRALAAEMIAKLRASYDAFLQFRAAWPAEAVRADTATFVKRTQWFVEKLRKSTLNEEDHLYDRVDGIYEAMRNKG